MFASKFLALFAFVASALALPSLSPPVVDVPSPAFHIAHDVENNALIAFDINGKVIGSYAVVNAVQKRQGGGCGLLTQNEASSLAGWSSITDYATSNWGGDWDSINVNPSQYPDSAAEVCVSGDVSQVTLDGTPACNTQTQTAGGSYTGASGTVSLSTNEGTTESTTITVTQQSTIGSQLQASTTIGIPDVANVTVQLQTTIQITNSVATATTAQTSDQTTQTVTLNAPANSTCTLTSQVTTCSVTGTGQIQYTARGWIWFYYGSQRNGHYQWAVSLESVITDPSQRSSYLQFQTQTSSTSNSQYQAVCQ